MPQVPFPSGGRALRSRRRHRFNRFLAIAGLFAIAVPLVLSELPASDDTLSVSPDRKPVEDAAALRPIVVASSPPHHWLLDPTPFIEPGTITFADDALLATTFKTPAVRSIATDVAATVGTEPLPSSPTQEVIENAAVPLPVPRPADLLSNRTAAPAQIAGGPTSRRNRTAALPSALVDNRSFFEKLLGAPPQSPGQALGYASLNAGGDGLSGSRLGSHSMATAGVAVYDISARLVHMPNGEKLEAHSGLRDKLDDPNFVHVRMQGATPPGVYDLTEREALFHGVRAIRLNPVGGSAAVHGRTGLLAHTYMLGPNGDSNGCVSFRHYEKFLQAFLKGEVKRLIVVSGRGQDRLPSTASNGTTGRANDT